MSVSLTSFLVWVLYVLRCGLWVWWATGFSDVQREQPAFVYLSQLMSQHPCT